MFYCTVGEGTVDILGADHFAADLETLLKELFVKGIKLGVCRHGDMVRYGEWLVSE